MIQFVGYLSQKGFQVRSYYKVLVNVGNITFPWKSLWKPKVPSRVLFFCLGCFIGKKFNSREFTEKKYNIGKLVLSMQRRWRNCRSVVVTLSFFKGILGYDAGPFWGPVGDAAKGGRCISLLAR